MEFLDQKDIKNFHRYCTFVKYIFNRFVIFHFMNLPLFTLAIPCVDTFRLYPIFCYNGLVINIFMSRLCFLKGKQAERKLSISKYVSETLLPQSYCKNDIQYYFFLKRALIKSWPRVFNTKLKSFRILYIYVLFQVLSSVMKITVKQKIE